MRSSPTPSTKRFSPAPSKHASSRKTGPGISATTAAAGQPIRDLEQFQQEWNESFQFNFVAEKDLTAREREVFRKTDALLVLAGGRPKNLESIKISETMRMDPRSFREVEGLWEPSKGRIIIKRSVLKSIERYAGTLLHEVCHATSGAPDVSDFFEEELTRLIGTLSAKSLDA